VETPPQKTKLWPLKKCIWGVCISAVIVAAVIIGTWKTDFSIFWRPIFVSGLFFFAKYFLGLDAVILIGYWGLRTLFKKEYHKLWTEKLEAPMRMAAFIVIGLSALISILIVAPYKAHEADQEEITRLKQQVASNTNQLALLQDEVKFWQGGIGGSIQVDGDDPYRYRFFANHSFNHSEWRNCVEFFELAFNNPAAASTPNLNQVLGEPFYYFAILKTNIDRSGIGTAEKNTAYKTFVSNFEDMKTRINQAVVNKEENNAYNSKMDLTNNAIFIARIINLIPDEETDVISQVMQIKNAVVGLQGKATNP